MAILQIMKDCFTGKDNETYDPARVFGYGVVVLGAIEYLALSAYQVLHTGVFNVTDYTVGLTGVAGAMAAAAAGVLIKHKAEPTA